MPSPEKKGCNKNIDTLPPQNPPKNKNEMCWICLRVSLKGVVCVHCLDISMS